MDFIPAVASKIEGPQICVVPTAIELSTVCLATYFTSRDDLFCRGRYHAILSNERLATASEQQFDPGARLS